MTALYVIISLVIGVFLGLILTTVVYSRQRVAVMKLFAKKFPEDLKQAYEEVFGGGSGA